MPSSDFQRRLYDMKTTNYYFCTCVKQFECGTALAQNIILRTYGESNVEDKETYAACWHDVAGSRPQCSSSWRKEDTTKEFVVPEGKSFWKIIFSLASLTHFIIGIFKSLLYYSKCNLKSRYKLNYFYIKLPPLSYAYAQNCVMQNLKNVQFCYRVHCSFQISSGPIIIFCTL